MRWFILTDIFVSTAHHSVHTHFLSQRVGVGVAKAVVSGLVLSVVLVASDGDHGLDHRLDHRLGHRWDHISGGGLVVFVGLSVGLVGVALALTILLVLVQEIVVMTIIVLRLSYHGGKF